MKGDGLKPHLEDKLLSALRRSQRVLQQTGPSPWLVAYDVNGIQEFISANSRPLAMKGASELLKDFDRDYLGRPETVFAGGGRGLLLLPSQDKAEIMQRELTQQFGVLSNGGVLATALSPFQRQDEAASLTLLRLRLDLAKDTAPAPGGQLPTGRQDACADCDTFQATTDSPRPNSQGERICNRCFTLIRRGQAASENRGSLVELSRYPQVAVVSADGNNLGHLFSNLSTLKACAAVSALVGEVFSQALEAAAKPLGNKLISVAAGGDDVRAFLAPSDCLTYVETLTRQVEEGLELAAGMLSQVVSPEEKTALQRAGLGVGLLIADATFPASRLLALAHRLEDNAKVKCRDASGDKRWRSGLDLGLMTAGELQIEERDPRDSTDGRPFSLDLRLWQRTLKQAGALQAVESSQRAWISEMHRMDVEEAHNLFRYQVARSDKWKAYYDMIGVRWHDKTAVTEAMPSAGLLTLARQLEKYPSEARAQEERP